MNVYAADVVAVETITTPVLGAADWLAVYVNPTVESPIPPTLFGVSQLTLLFTAQAVLDAVVVT